MRRLCFHPLLESCRSPSSLDFLLLGLLSPDSRWPPPTLLFIQQGSKDPLPEEVDHHSLRVPGPPTP